MIPMTVPHTEEVSEAVVYFPLVLTMMMLMARAAVP